MVFLRNESNGIHPRVFFPDNIIWRGYWEHLSDISLFHILEMVDVEEIFKIRFVGFEGHKRNLKIVLLNEANYKFNSETQFLIEFNKDFYGQGTVLHGVLSKNLVTYDKGRYRKHNK